MPPKAAAKKPSTSKSPDKKGAKSPDKKGGKSSDKKEAAKDVAKKGGAEKQEDAEKSRLQK